MSRRRGFLLCAVPALSTVLLASDGRIPAATAGSPGSDAASERSVPTLFSWGDIDGDDRLDLAAVSGDGTLQILASAGKSRFEDVTERVGLADVGNAALALWADYDDDGRLDLFVGAREGASRLFHNEGGGFIDMSAGSGLVSAGAVQSAQWLDHDGDGRLDLFLVTAEKNELFRGIEGGFFEVQDLPLAGAPAAPGLGASVADAGARDTDGLGTPFAPGSSNEKDGTRPGRSSGGLVGLGGANASGARIVRGPTPSGVPTLPFLAGPACLDSIGDQANPSTCLKASTTPTLGRLYPLSANLFVALGGAVGIGTTSPAAKLDVAGTVRMTDTLTLNPGGDQALDVSTGSIYKGGALFIHTKGNSNTALGEQALASVTTGIFNTASGHRALTSNTLGNYNTACGYGALQSNTTASRNTALGSGTLFNTTTGRRNTACGYVALYANTTGAFNTGVGNGVLGSNTSGMRNTAIGAFALPSNTTSGYNTATGYRALSSNTTGAGNIAVGAFAGSNLTTGNDNIAIGNPGVAGEGGTIRIGASGTHTRGFIAGIRGVTTDIADAIPVLVDSAGQLGTVSSSRRFKKEIRDMGGATERLLELRPVVFRYKQEQTVPTGEVPLEYGLIAEEVAEIFPDLVVYDEEGQPFTVKYHLLSSMLLNELKKQAGEMDELHERLEAQGVAQERELKELRTRLAAVEAQTSRASLPAAISADSR